MKYLKEENEIFTYKLIVNELQLNQSLLSEGVVINEGVVDILKKYASKGLITAGILASLLISNQANAQDLKDAGIDRNKIENAIKDLENNPELQKLESKFLNTLKRDGRTGTLSNYNKLNNVERTAILLLIQDKLNDGANLSKLDFSFNDSKRDLTNPNLVKVSQTDQKVNRISVDTINVVTQDNISTYFNPNSIKLNQSPEKELKNLLDKYVKINKITIRASSNTLRNTGEAENMTWLELSTKRAEEIKNIILNIGYYDLGGCGVNKVQIGDSLITINAGGVNGDGTSGPKSPYEVNDQNIKTYQEKGIDEKYWKSNATQEPLANLQDYAKFQYVIVEIDGYMVDEVEQQYVDYVPVYKYFKVTELQGKIKKEQRVERKFKANTCPVKVTVKK
jgi:outer membrane protein OmpA-like peptidoglycan-associated protein